VRSAGGDREGFEFLFYKVSEVLVSSFSQAGDVNDRPLDAVSLAFQKIVVEYKEQKVSGEIGSVVNFGWDLKANKKV
jgi:type VI secretion system secreted protein Hcp